MNILECKCIIKLLKTARKPKVDGAHSYTNTIKLLL